MEQDTQIELDHPDAGRRHGLIIWAARGALALCGGLLVLVVLSNPVIAPRLMAAVSPGEEADAQTAFPADPAHVQSTVPENESRAARRSAKEEKRSRPAVTAMPGSRTPVRRAGVKDGN